MNGAGKSALSLVEARLGFQSNVGRIAALDGLSAEIERGSITCIVGPNGAGKTTLLRVAAGLADLDTGSCALFGRSLADWPRADLARHVAYLPQGGEAAWPLSARDIVALGRMPHGAGLGKESAQDRTAIDHALRRGDVAHLAGRRVDFLSAGERARVLFARALATGADLLLADEPAAHLDPAHQLRLMALLAEEARRGAAVLVTMHELSLAARCDFVLVLDEGRLAAAGRPQDALNDKVLAEVFGIAVARAEMEDGGPAPVPSRLI